MGETRQIALALADALCHQPWPLWTLHIEALILSRLFHPDPCPLRYFPPPLPTIPGPRNNGSSLSFLSLDSHFQISALEARYPPEDFYIELRHLSHPAEPHSPGQMPQSYPPPSQTSPSPCPTPHPYLSHSHGPRSLVAEPSPPSQCQSNAQP